MEKYLSDAEILEKYSLKKSNSNKSLAPLYIYLILQGARGKHFTQAEIAKELSSRFEANLERKAIGRILHSLSDANVGVISTSDNGSWFEQ